MFYLLQYLTNILPNAEAAAVLIKPFPFTPWHEDFLNVSTIPITVKGLTIPDDEHSIGTSSSIIQILSTLATEYSAHEPDIVVKETFFPTKWEFCYFPAFTTSPKPSSPPINGTLVCLYPPLTAALSEGLIVDPITLIWT